MNKKNLCFVFIAMCAACATDTYAQCGSAGALSGSARSPRMWSANALSARDPELKGQESRGYSNTAITGLWDVTFKSGLEVYDQGYDQFHSDGTEILNDTPNPAAGNVCLGVWVQVGPAVYKLHHVFWNFDHVGTLTGRGEWDSTITVDQSGLHYSGKWELRNYDLHDALIAAGALAPVTGTMTATRITP